MTVCGALALMDFVPPSLVYCNVVGVTVKSITDSPSESSSLPQENAVIRNGRAIRTCFKSLFIVFFVFFWEISGGARFAHRLLGNLFTSYVYQNCGTAKRLWMVKLSSIFSAKPKPTTHPSAAVPKAQPNSAVLPNSFLSSRRYLESSLLSMTFFLS